MYWMLHIALISALLYALRPRELAGWYLAGVALKMTAGILVGWYFMVFTQSGDTVAFHQKALVYYQLATENFNEYLQALFSTQYPLFKSESRNEFFIKLLSLCYVSTGANYWITTLYFSVVSFLVSWKLFETIIHFYPLAKWPSIFALFLVPSVALWTSGIFKDTISYAALLYVIHVGINYYESKQTNFQKIPWLILALLTLIYLKYYLAAIALLFLGVLAWLQISKLIRSKRLRWVFSALTLMALLFGVTQLNFNLNLENLPQSIYDNYQAILQGSERENVIIMDQLAPDWISLIGHFPKGLVAGTIRPFIGESSFWWLEIESLLVIILLLMNLHPKNKLPSNALFYIAVVLIAMTAIFLSLSSPNFGTLARYRIAYYPFFILLISYFPIQRILSYRQ